MAYTDADRAFDELLVLYVLSGDKRALDRLGVRWQPRLLSVAIHLTGDRELAQDAAQETWIGIIKGLSKLRDASRFGPWAFGILRRKCSDRIRVVSSDRTRKTSLDKTNDEPFEAGRFETLTELKQAFASLTEDHRLVASLFFLEGLTLAEIAGLIDRPLGTVQSRVFHARKQLKAHLKGDDNV